MLISSLYYPLRVRVAARALQRTFQVLTAAAGSKSAVADPVAAAAVVTAVAAVPAVANPAAVVPAVAPPTTLSEPARAGAALGCTSCAEPLPRRICSTDQGTGRGRECHHVGDLACRGLNGLDTFQYAPWRIEWSGAMCYIQ